MNEYIYFTCVHTALIVVFQGVQLTLYVDQVWLTFLQAQTVEILFPVASESRRLSELVSHTQSGSSLSLLLVVARRKDFQQQ